MNKLFRAGLYRLRKNKGAYACVIIPPIYSVCLMFSQYMQMKESGANYLLDPFLFHFLLVMGVLLSVFVSLYVGTEYHDGTLRNKLISGSSRNAVYGSNLWISFLVGTCSVLLAYTAGFAAGIPMFGVIEMPALTMLQNCVAGILLVLSYVSIFYDGVCGDCFFEIVSAGDDHTGGNRKWRNRYGNSKKSCLSDGNKPYGLSKYPGFSAGRAGRTDF